MSILKIETLKTCCLVTAIFLLGIFCSKDTCLPIISGCAEIISRQQTMSSFQNTVLEMLGRNFYRKVTLEWKSRHHICFDEKKKKF